MKETPSAVIPTDSGTPRMGCATVTAFNPMGESIFSLPIAWQEVSGND